MKMLTYHTELTYVSDRISPKEDQELIAELQLLPFVGEVACQKGSIRLVLVSLSPIDPTTVSEVNRRAEILINSYYVRKTAKPVEPPAKVYIVSDSKNVDIGEALPVFASTNRQQAWQHYRDLLIHYLDAASDDFMVGESTWARFRGVIEYVRYVNPDDDLQDMIDTVPFDNPLTFSELTLHDGKEA